MPNQKDFNTHFTTTSNVVTTVPVGRLSGPGSGALLNLKLLGRDASHLVINIISAGFSVNAAGIPKVQAVQQSTTLGDTNPAQVQFSIDPVTFVINMAVTGVHNFNLSWTVSGCLMQS